ncbi:hypothetical protein HMPREF1978_01915 [Actinomyces graevenitzii F0530]|jgi:hypothetical protein|uniref:Tat pathway signal sequence domain protein n=1 Tax=Actinomyces graevenitzii F0530 TaxID=1321817 RepID=U1PVL0_9ACTO|nr:hypothetical protein [Actinomyces graevenitzii]ERH14189.1 hypothetical protein HMPREF1978_01915 [Actinomyces graevenitzii F0530]
MSIFKRIRTKALSLGAAAALAVGGALVASPAQAAMAFTIHANVNIESMTNTVYQVDIAVDGDNGTIITQVCPNIKAAIPATAGTTTDATVVDGTDGGKVCRLVVKGDTATILGGKEEKGEFTFDASTLTGSLSSLQAVGTYKMDMKVTYPGDVTSANGGSISGNTVTFADGTTASTITGKVSAEKKAEPTATAKATAAEKSSDSGLSTGLIIGGVAAVLVIAIVVVAVVVSSKRKQKIAQGR